MLESSTQNWNCSTKNCSKQIFGEVAAYMFVIEFQKRGLSHADFLIVCAKLRNEKTKKHLFNMVYNHMMHGPCGRLKPNNVCMQGRVLKLCKNKYPKQWVEETTHGENAYPTYRRRKDGKVVIVRGKELDNRWVVPYNRTFSLSSTATST